MTRPPLRLAAALWMLLAAAATVHVCVSPENHNRWPMFRAGADAWMHGRSIYAGSDFRYSPAFAAVIAPLVALPTFGGRVPLGNIVFDVGTLALLFFAVRALVRTALPAAVMSRDEPAVLILSLAGIVRSVWASQAHVLAAACVFFAAAALIQRRWWPAAFALALAVHVKMAPLALAGLVGVVWPRAMIGRLLVALAAWTGLVFVAGDFHGGARALEEWVQAMRGASNERFPSFRDAWHVFEVAGVAIPVGAYRVLQLAGAAAASLWVLRLRRRLPDGPALVTGVFGAGICFMLAFGPAVEFVQYPLLAPLVGAAVLAAPRAPMRRAALVLIYVLTMIAGFGGIERALGACGVGRASELLLITGLAGFTCWFVMTWERRLLTSDGTPGGLPSPPRTLRDTST